MFPVKDDACKQAVINVLTLQWNDTEKCRHCTSEGLYHLSKWHADGLNAQETLLSDVEGVFAGTAALAPVSGDAE